MKLHSVIQSFDCVLDSGSTYKSCVNNMYSFVSLCIIVILPVQLSCIYEFLLIFVYYSLFIFTIFSITFGGYFYGLTFPRCSFHGAPSACHLTKERGVLPALFMSCPLSGSPEQIEAWFYNILYGWIFQSRGGSRSFGNTSQTNPDILQDESFLRILTGSIIFLFLQNPD